MPQPKRSRSWVRAPAESLYSIKHSPSEDAFLLYMPRPKRNGSWVRAPAESLNSIKHSPSKDAFCVSYNLSNMNAPTKTQQVLGSSPSRITFKQKHPLPENAFSYFYPLIFYSKQTGNKICLEDNTERSESNPGRSLGTIY